MAEELMALKKAWLDTNTADVGQYMNTSFGTGGPSGTCLTNYYYHYYPQWYYPVTQTITVTPPPARPIRLRFNEVERLRKAAKNDKALAEILRKFTQQIEVVMEFD